MTIAIPSLSTAFSSLLGGLTSAFKTPAVPQLSAPQIGPSSLSALGMSTPSSANMSVYKPAPAVPNMSVYTPPAVSNPKPAAVPASGIGYSNGKPVASMVAPGNFNLTPAVPKIAAPAPTPVAPRVSAPTPSYSAPAPVQTPSGYASPSTGGMVNGAATAPPAAYNYDTTNGGGSSPTLPDLSQNPLFSDVNEQALVKAYQDAQQMSPEEVAAQQNLNRLNVSASTAYTNTEGQAIPLPFITGQQAAIQRSQALLSQPLESQLSLLQAKRQLATEASQFALGREDTKLAALREFAKPVATTYGGTLSKYNPTTGQYETVVNPFGSASGTAAGTDSQTQAILGQLAAAGVDITRYNTPALIAAVQNGATPQDIIAGRGAAAGVKAAAVATATAGPAADAASLKTQQAYLDTTNRAYQTATANFGVLSQFMSQYGINQSNVPVINQLQNKIKAGLTDPGAIAAFQTQLSGLRSEYAQVLSRGGEVTDASRNAALSLIPDNLSPSQMATIKTQLDKEGGNAIKEAQSQITTIQGRLNSNGSPGQTNFGNPAPSSGNPFSAANFFGT